MNGYDACLLINQHLTLSQDDKNVPDFSHKARHKKKVFIYALTSDCSEEVNATIKRFPFDRKFEILNNRCEVKMIIQDIKQER